MLFNVEVEERIDRVIRLVAYHRDHLLRQLFPGNSNYLSSYREQWHQRYKDNGFSGFWFHLDTENRHKLINLAWNYYKEATEEKE